MSKEEVIAAIQESAARLGHVPTITEVRRTMKMGKHEIRKHFLTYSRALSESGLKRTGPGYEADATELFKDWAGLVRKLGKLPTMAEYEMHGSYSVRPLIRRHGGWVHVPAGYRILPGKKSSKGNGPMCWTLLRSTRKRKRMRDVRPAARMAERRGLGY